MRNEKSYERGPFSCKRDHSRREFFSKKTRPDFLTIYHILAFELFTQGRANRSENVGEVEILLRACVRLFGQTGGAPEVGALFEHNHILDLVESDGGQMRYNQSK